MIYSLGAFLSYAVLRYLSFFLGGLNLGATDEFVTIRVFFSGPLLIILGVILFLGFKHYVHKVLGTLFAFGGVAWAIVVIMAIAEESRV